MPNIADWLREQQALVERETTSEATSSEVGSPPEQLEEWEDSDESAGNFYSAPEFFHEEARVISSRSHKFDLIGDDFEHRDL